MRSKPWLKHTKAFLFFRKELQRHEKSILHNNIICRERLYRSLRRNTLRRTYSKRFLNQLLEERKEWGYIRIYNKKEKKKSYYISYNHGNVNNYDIPDSIMNAKIVMADGSGGWSRSDFALTVDVEVKLQMQTTILYMDILNDSWILRKLSRRERRF